MFSRFECIICTILCSRHATEEKSNTLEFSAFKCALQNVWSLSAFRQKKMQLKCFYCKKCHSLTEKKNPIRIEKFAKNIIFILCSNFFFCLKRQKLLYCDDKNLSNKRKRGCADKTEKILNFKRTLLNFLLFRIYLNWNLRYKFFFFWKNKSILIKS